MQFKIEKGKEFENVLIEEGVYYATYICLKEISDGKFGKRFAMEFEVLEPKSREIVNLSMIGYGGHNLLSENSKIGKAFIIMGVKLGEEFDSDQIPIFKRKVKVLVETFVDDNGKEKSIITKVKPLTE